MNHHCTIVEIEGLGIAIEGEAGAGKTSLAMGLLESARGCGLTAHFVCDDQAILHREAGALIATCPDALAGKAELRGYGIVRLPHKPRTVLHLLARLVPESEVPRMPDPTRTTLHGNEIAFLALPQRHESGAIRILLAWIRDSIGSTDAPDAQN